MARPEPMWAYIEDDGQIVFKPAGVGPPHLTWRSDPDDRSIVRCVIDYAALLLYLADNIGAASSTSGPGLRDGIRERLSPWPTDSGDPVEDRNLLAAPPEVGDDPACSDGSTATDGPAVGTGESSALTSPFPQVLIDELDAIDSEAHADDQPADPASITFRSTGRGAHEVVENRAEGPDRVLAMVQFTEGVRGWRGAMERITAHLASVSQDGAQ